jgi:hypothetical protein
VLFRNDDVALIILLTLIVALTPNFQDIKRKYANEFNKRYFVIIISALIFIPIYKILFEANRVHEFLYFDF